MTEVTSCHTSTKRINYLVKNAVVQMSSCIFLSQNANNRIKTMQILTFSNA